jgi:hypothetical protein
VRVGDTVEKVGSGKQTDAIHEFGEYKMGKDKN